MPAVNISAARAELPKLIDAVERGEEVTLTRHGRPVAVLVPPDRLRSRRAGDAFAAAAAVRDGEKSAAAIVERVRRELGRHARLRLEYVEVVDADTLAPGRADRLAAEVLADRGGR